MPATVEHILQNVLISQSTSESGGVIILVRPDFGVRVRSEAIRPNSSPARVELDSRRKEIRVWIDDRSGSSKPNRIVRNALAGASKRKIVCSVCGEMDIDEFVGAEMQAWGANGWRVDGGRALCPDCVGKS